MRTIDVAEGELAQGIREDPPGSNGGIPETRYNKGGKVSWCASFVLYCNEQSDEDERLMRPSPEMGWRTALAAFYECRNVRAFELFLMSHQLWVPVNSPQVTERNDIAFFSDRGQSDPGKGRHVALVQDYDVIRNVLTTVDGNWGDKVCKVVHDLGDPKELGRITGYARIPRKAA